MNNVFNTTLIGQCDQVMHFEVITVIDKKKFFVSFIYGDNDPRVRLKLWDNLKEHMVGIINMPWVILGDLMLLYMLTRILVGFLIVIRVSKSLEIVFVTLIGRM